MLVITFFLILFMIFTYHYPRVGVVLGGLGIATIVLLLLFVGAILSGNVFIGHETFYTALFLAVIAVFSAYYFAYLNAKFGRRKQMLLLDGTLIFLMALGMLSFGYQWEVSDVLSKSCATCDRPGNTLISNSISNRYAYDPTGTANQDFLGGVLGKPYPFAHCIIWDDAWATTSCLYSDIVAQIILLSLGLALASVAYCFWLTQELGPSSPSTFPEAT